MISSSRGARVAAPMRRQLLAVMIAALLLTTLLPHPFNLSQPPSTLAAGNVSLSALGTPYTEDFDTLASSGTSSTLPNGWYLSETGTNANTTYSASDGTGTGSGTPPSISGDTYSFGSTGSTERAYGCIQSGSLVPTIGALFTNNTGSAITSLTISYTGEQWRLGTAGRADRIDFQYSTTASSISSGTFTDVDALDFSSPITTGTLGPLDGNAAANKTAISSTITGLSIANGGTFVIRWNDFNASGADDGLSVDNFSLTPNGVGGGGGPTNPSGIGAANPATVVTGGSTLLTVNVTPGSNPVSTGLAVTANLTSIGGSATQAFFDDGTNGDDTAGDNIFSYQATVSAGTSLGAKSLPVTITDAEARTGNTAISLSVASASGVTPINAIQGATCATPNCVTISPMVGQVVTTQGVVTALRSNGFFIQTPDASVDSDPTTSEGILIFTSSAPPAAAAVGNLVNVTGTVSEFSPSADPNSPPETELTGPTASLISTGNPLPAPFTITAADTNPSGGFEQLEKYEGMRVHVNSLTVVAPTAGSINEANATSTSTGVFYGVITGLPRPFLEPGIRIPNPVPTPAPSGTPPPNVPRFDNNPERIRIDSDVQPGTTAIEVSTGAVVTNITGPLDYAFRAYTILPDPSPAPGVTPGIAAAIPVPTPTANEFTVGSFNLERFFDTTDDAGVSDVALTATAFNNRLNKASLAIRDIMRSPDIIGVCEVENLTTLQAIANKINNDAVAATGINPNYQGFLSEGNDIGGIDVGFLVKTSRVAVVDVTQFGKTTTYVEPGGTTALLNDRPPLVLRANVTRPLGGTQPVTVIVNHLRSLSGIDGTDGARIRAKRRAQAEYLANLIQARQVADPTENIISVGDYNAFQINDGYVDVIGTIKGTPTPADQVVLASSDLVNPDLTDLVETLPANARYSYTFDGNAQTIDHELINGNLARRFSRFAIAHLDADYPDSLRNDPNRPERISDHDAEVGYFDLSAAPRQKTRADFDGDRNTDVSIFRSSDGVWSVINSGGTPSRSSQWGDSADKLVPGDYDGDFKTDFAVWRPNEGSWYIINSITGAVSIKGWGASSDIPVPGDYDGDNKTDLAVWRPSEGNWYIINSSGGSVTVRGWGAGSQGDIPVPNDYDGDGKTDIAVWRPSEGNWYIINSSNGTVTVQGWGAGSLGDKLVPADYDGDGRTDIGVFRPGEGNWYILNSGGGITVRGWGASTDKLVPGDYDGDGKVDIAVYRPSEGNWYVIGSASGTAFLLSSSNLGDTPIPSVLIPQ